jgi:hypothetical protein
MLLAAAMKYKIYIIVILFIIRYKYVKSLFFSLRLGDILGK